MFNSLAMGIRKIKIHVMAHANTPITSPTPIENKIWRMAMTLIKIVQTKVVKNSFVSFYS
jgi:hypothetical protein